MHHKNHKNSTTNHNNPQHQKSQFPTKPAPSSEKKNLLSRFREKFQEKPATKEEVMQLGLDAKREYYKTMKMKAKAARPSRFGSFGGGGGSSPSYRRSSSRAPQTGSFLMSESPGSWLMGPSSGPSLDFITGGSSKPTRGKQQKSGLEELF